MIKLAESPSFARPADTAIYASGDLVANSTTAGSVVPTSINVAGKKAGAGKIRRVRLFKSGAVLTNAAFRVHLHSGAPVASNGDNAAWLTTRAGYLGSFDVTIDKAFAAGSEGAGVPTVGVAVAFKAPAGQTRLYWTLEARAAYTPASGETFSLLAEVDQEEWTG